MALRGVEWPLRPGSMRDYLLTYVNGQPLQVRGDEAFLPLSDFLRRRQRLTGTKVVCSEGDCGACMALVGRLDGDRVAYVPVTSCIQFMFQLDAVHVVTIEGLADRDGLNAVQASMVK